MTECKAYGNRRKRESRKSGCAIFTSKVIDGILPLLLFLLLLFILIFHSAEAGGFALSGMSLAVMTVLPTAFPSMLICDIYRAFGYPERIPCFGRIFSRMFGISPFGIRAFILGNLCGFPMGAREVGAAYRDRLLSIEEAQRLVPICSNPSPAFVIGAVGGLAGDLRVGVILFLCVILSSVVCGVLGRKRGGICAVLNNVSRQKYSVVESIRSSGGALILIFSFITAFSIPLGFINKYLKFTPIKCLLFAVLEVAGGVNFFLSSGEFSTLSSGVLCAFTLGFGGVSVMLQSMAFLTDYGISSKGYLYAKLLQGLICGGMYFCAFSILF